MNLLECLGVLFIAGVIIGFGLWFTGRMEFVDTEDDE